MRVLITIGFSLTTAPIQTYFGVERLAISADVHTGPATAPDVGVPHETVILIVFSAVGNPVPIVTANVPTVAGRVVQVAAEKFVRSGGGLYWTKAPRSRIACLTWI